MHEKNKMSSVQASNQNVLRKVTWDQQLSENRKIWQKNIIEHR